jgi:hypothetical protein
MVLEFGSALVLGQPVLIAWARDALKHDHAVLQRSNLAIGERRQERRGRPPCGASGRPPAAVAERRRPARVVNEKEPLRRSSRLRMGHDRTQQGAERRSA